MFVNYTPKDIEKNIIHTLRNTRKNLNFTQSDIAKKLNVSRDTIARIETGQSRLTLEFAVAIAHYLDLELNKLLLNLELKENTLKKNEENSQSQSDTFYKVKTNYYYKNNRIIISSSQTTLEGQPKTQLNPYLNMNAIKMFGEEMNQFILNHRLFWWWVSEEDLSDLSIAAVTEAILNRGNELDISTFLKIVGVEQVADIFIEANKGSRSNYTEDVITFFDSYFKKHVPGYTR